MSRNVGRAKYLLRVQEVLARAPKPFLLLSVDSLELNGRLHTAFKRLKVRRVGDLAVPFSADRLDGVGLGLASLRDLHSLLEESVESFVFANSHLPQLSNPLNSQALDHHSENGYEPEDYQDEGGIPASADVQPDSSNLETFAELLENGLRAIGGRDTEVLSRRAGVAGRPETLEAIAGSLGLTRERIRQIQSKAMLRLRTQVPIAQILEEKLLRLLENRTSPLYLAALPAEDVWFEGTRFPESVIDFLIDSLPISKLGTIVLHGRRVATKGTQGEWDRRVNSATDFVKERCGFGLTESSLRVAVEAIAGFEFKELSDDLFDIASRHAVYADMPEGKVLVAVGRGANQKVMAVLEGSDRPLHYSEIARRVSDSFGQVDIRRVHSAADGVGLLLGRGIYGLRKHVPISDTEAAYLASLCEEMINDGPSGRQWHASELLSQLHESEPIAQRLNHFELSVSLKEHSDLQYMGRQIWMLAGESGGQPQKRLDVQNAVEAVLRDAGSTLTAFEIFERVSSIRGIGAHFQIHPKGIVFRVGPSTWGLTTRDLSIPAQDLRSHLTRLASCLNESHSAIHVSEISDKLGLSGKSDEQAWQIFGAAQLDERFKSFMSDYLGLADWSATGRLAVHDALRLVIEELTTGATTEHIQERMEVSLGRRVSADTVKSALRDRGATYDRLRGVWALDLAVEIDEEDRAPLDG